eukprot:5214566-Pleurochrysis_carterae.AAC.1
MPRVGWHSLASTFPPPRASRPAYVVGGSGDARARVWVARARPQSSPRAAGVQLVVGRCARAGVRVPRASAVEPVCRP